MEEVVERMSESKTREEPQNSSPGLVTAMTVRNSEASR